MTDTIKLISFMNVLTILKLLMIILLIAKRNIHLNVYYILGINNESMICLL